MIIMIVCIVCKMFLSKNEKIIDMCINISLPQKLCCYMHRIGRGRREGEKKTKKRRQERKREWR